MKIGTLLILILLTAHLNAQVSTIQQRIESRDFPSVFQAWNKADNLSGEDALSTLARHDLFFSSPRAFKLVWAGSHEGLATEFSPESVSKAKEYKKILLAKNPNIITIAEIRYRDAYSNFLPTDSKWWMRDSVGNYVFGWEEGHCIRMEIRDTNFQNNVAAQAAAIVNTGVVDGVMLDWWYEGEFLTERISLLKKVRAAIGDKAILILNSNHLKVPHSSPYANGLFMECWNSPDATASDWIDYRTTLEWAEQNMRNPRLNLLETWYKDGRNDLSMMRATATLALTRSDGYTLFSDPNTLPVPDHAHSWYEFYNAPLGKPIASGFKRADNAYQREFSNGTVVYNPLGNRDVEIEFLKPHKSMATGLIQNKHSVPVFDGDVFIPGNTLNPGNQGTTD